MSKKPTQKKTPFVIEPLNWVAPDNKRAETVARREQEAAPRAAKETDKN